MASATTCACGIVAGIDRASADPAVKAVVMIGNERAFSGGADIREFGSPKAYALPTCPP
jgi:3-hydroxyacyl-CoA dehydrogenase